MIDAGRKQPAILASLLVAGAIAFAGLVASPVKAEDAPAAAAAADPAAPAPGKKAKKARAKAPASLESRHQVCLSFIQRHGLSCDPWVEPTCGAEVGYFRPMECVRPRSQ